MCFEIYAPHSAVQDPQISAENAAFPGQNPLPSECYALEAVCAPFADQPFASLSPEAEPPIEKRFAVLAPPDGNSPRYDEHKQQSVAATRFEALIVLSERRKKRVSIITSRNVL